MGYDKQIRLGSRLHYPVTITKLLKKPGDTINKQDTILEYTYTWRRHIRDEEWADEKTYTEFTSPASGVLKEWLLEEGMAVNADRALMTVEESCPHDVQVHGLCTLCGADLTEVSWASEERETDRAKINMTHDQTGLMVSNRVAAQAEHTAQRRLLGDKKLSLVVDLDQTIIHACIDPTVGEWRADPQNPNHEAVKDVKSFHLKDELPRGSTQGCEYYIKMRPGLQDFLEAVSKKYELHVYTMGTRAYAQQVARIVDPDHKYFGNRVISRDENGSITAKTLQRLFPVSTNMVVIIDDRADVWPMNRPNLIKVVPYDFFKGIGDINGSFLPPRTDTVPSAPPKPNGVDTSSATPEAESTTAAVTGSKASPLDEIARMSAAGDDTSLQEQVEEQEKTLEKQLNDRPLQHMQEELEQEDASQDDNSGANDTPAHRRSHVLNDDDEELVALQDHLMDLHEAFYKIYDDRRNQRRKGQPRHNPGEAALRRPSSDEGIDLSLVPDVGDILEDLKSSVLEGMVLVLSGLVPLGVRVEDSDIGIQAQSFGAQVLDSVSKRVTHLVVSSARPRTKKVQQAAKIPSIHIVNQNWLQDCLSQWRRLDESPYYITVSSADRAPDEDVTDGASEDDDDTAIKDFSSMNWDAANDEEIQELLGLDSDDDLNSDDDDSKTLSSESGAETDGNETDGSTRRRGIKRKVPTDDGEGDSEGGSALAKKQRVARNRGASGLRSAVTPNGDYDDEEGSSLPTPGPTTGDESQTQEEADFEAELERELLAELEAAEE